MARLYGCTENAVNLKPVMVASLSGTLALVVGLAVLCFAAVVWRYTGG